MGSFGASCGVNQIDNYAESGFGDVFLVASFHLVKGPRQNFPPAETPETLVLIASDRDAIMCSNSDGKSRIIGEVASGYRRQLNPPMQGKRAAGERPDSLAFARDLMEFLKREISRRYYEDVVILANDAIREELRRVARDELPRFFNSHPTDMSARSPHPT
jgi:hypothetical protein